MWRDLLDLFAALFALAVFAALALAIMPEGSAQPANPFTPVEAAMSDK